MQTVHITARIAAAEPHLWQCYLVCLLLHVSSQFCFVMAGIIVTMKLYSDRKLYAGYPS